ncbi:unnamed protein product [Pleuronectes platessa]|uniref:Large ribosomal subunit protein mL51 n=1 Tax=Pleuronectes platessa TaxID=8262 RepID=A0A9N7ZA28_PLEPL|nr:unnamed protein product [Pleuronectes platessa]
MEILRHKDLRHVGAGRQNTWDMSVLGALLRAGATFRHSAGSLLQTARGFSTGTCCQIRMHAIPQPKRVDRWTEKRSMFGVYDNIGILGNFCLLPVCGAKTDKSPFVPAGDFKAHPKDLIIAPCWLKGFKGNELQRLIRKKKMVGNRMMTLEKHNLEKRIKFLYKHFNRFGKHR